jgi:hypothetical protein
VTQTPSRQRYFAPLFFGLALLDIALGIQELVKGDSLLAVASTPVIAGVLIALGLRTLKPTPTPSAQRPLRVPRPPR